MEPGAAIDGAAAPGALERRGLDGRRVYVQAARHAAARRKSDLIASLRALDRLAPAADLLAKLRTHSLARLILGVLGEPELREALSAEVVDTLETWRRLPWVPNDALLRAFDDARRTLAAAGIPVLLLKGAWFAERLYGGLDHRPQLDVDALVPRADFGRACRILRHSGFEPLGYDAHSRTLARGGCKLDLHWCLRSAPAYRLDQSAIWSETIEVAIGGGVQRTLSDEWHLVLLALTLLEDVGQGTAKLRQLLDLSLLLRDTDGDADWPRFFARRAGERILGCVVNAFALTLALFEMTGEAPRLRRVLDQHRALLDRATIADPLGLVFAPRKNVENLEWFARIYPGSLFAYLAAFWWGGFPSNLRGADLARLAASLRLVARHPRSDGLAAP